MEDMIHEIYGQSAQRLLLIRLSWGTILDRDVWILGIILYCR